MVINVNVVNIMYRRLARGTYIIHDRTWAMYALTYPYGYRQIVYLHIFRECMG